MTKYCHDFETLRIPFSTLHRFDDITTYFMSKELDVMSLIDKYLKT